MGQCLSQDTVEKNNQLEVVSHSKIQNIDIVKVKLKLARDRISNFVNAKNRDMSNIEIRIKQKIPKYQQTGNRKQLIPLLKSKRDLASFIDAAQLRLNLLNDKLNEVEMQKVNLDTINALQDANKYIKQIQMNLQRKDWKSILQEAKHKYEVQWPQDQQNLQNDPTYQKMWNELGGNRIPTKKGTSVILPAYSNMKKTQAPLQINT